MRYTKTFQFSRPPPPVHLRQKFFHSLDLGRPISNETSSPNDTVHVNEQNRIKNKSKSRHIQMNLLGFVGDVGGGFVSGSKKIAWV